MRSFSFVAVTSEGEALRSGAGSGGHDGELTRGGAFLAGGTTLIDLMKLGVITPDKIVDVNRLPLTAIEDRGGGVRVGALVRNSQMAWHPLIETRYPMLSQAILQGASAQIRNVATTAGNLLQRTRCYYYRDTAYPPPPCNMRQPGSGCAAIDGFNRIHAVLGTSDKCIATHPSDMCVALAALDADVIIAATDGSERRVPMQEFYVAYGEDPARWHTLRPGELITAVELPNLPMARRSAYLKVRDRASYEFALASAAVALRIDNGTIADARVGLGGVAARPWRSRDAEEALIGKPAAEATYRTSADAAMHGAQPQKFNAFKIDLAKRTIARALAMVAEMT